MRASVNYCQVCGHAMEHRQTYGKLRPVCPACGFIYFADPKVAAVAFIEQDDRVLLVQRARNPERGKWALPAGYIDYGEDPRAACIREVREETGLEIAISRLIAVESGPQEFGASIVIIFRGNVIGGDARAQDDADALMWYTAHDPLPELAFESTHTMLGFWLEQHRQT